MSNDPVSHLVMDDASVACVYAAVTRAMSVNGTDSFPLTLSPQPSPMRETNFLMAVA